MREMVDIGKEDWLIIYAALSIGEVSDPSFSEFNRVKRKVSKLIAAHYNFQAYIDNDREALRF